MREIARSGAFLPPMGWSAAGWPSGLWRAAAYRNVAWFVLYLSDRWRFRNGPALAVRGSLAARAPRPGMAGRGPIRSLNF